MGEQMFDKLYQAGFNTISRILNMVANDIFSIDGFAEGTANIILSNMEKIKSGIDLPTLMQASDCFPGIGTIKARKLIDSLPGDEEENLYNVDFIYDDEFVNNRIEANTISVNTNGKCAGMAVCFSGVRNAELEQRIIEAGGTIVSGVSKKTTHLIVKDVNATSSKITKAQGLGVVIVNIDDFIAQL